MARLDESQKIPQYRSFNISDSQNDRVIVVGPEGTKEIPYEWGLAGPRGAWFTLYPSEDIPPLYLAEAQLCLRREQDVVRLTIVRKRG